MLYFLSFVTNCLASYLAARECFALHIVLMLEQCMFTFIFLYALISYALISITFIVT